MIRYSLVGDQKANPVAKIAAQINSLLAGSDLAPYQYIEEIPELVHKLTGDDAGPLALIIQAQFETGAKLSEVCTWHIISAILIGNKSEAEFEHKAKLACELLETMLVEVIEKREAYLQSLRDGAK